MSHKKEIPIKKKIRMAKVTEPLKFPHQWLTEIEDIAREYEQIGIKIEDDDEDDDGDRTTTIPLANRTIRVLNDIATNLQEKPLTTSEILVLDRMIVVGDIITGNTKSLCLAKRFGKIYHDLAYDQIYTHKGNDGIPPLPFTANYPLKSALPKFERHQLREHPDTRVNENGIVTEGFIKGVDDDFPIFDFMFDEDEALNRAFLLIVKFFAHLTYV